MYFHQYENWNSALPVLRASSNSCIIGMFLSFIGWLISIEFEISLLHSITKFGFIAFLFLCTVLAILSVRAEALLKKHFFHYKHHYDNDITKTNI